MPHIDVSENQILDAIGGLSPRARREALRRLVPRLDEIDRIAERSRDRLEALARARGLDWATLTDDERLALVDDLLHDAPAP